MGEITQIALGVRSNPARNQQGGNARLINCRAEQAGEDAKAPWIIYGTPGLLAFGDVLDGDGIRAMIEVGGTLYVVAGRNIYAVTSGGAATLIGGIPTDGPVVMVRNRRVPVQIGIVSDGIYAIIDTGANSVTQISDPDLPSPISIEFLDGYFVLPIANGRFMITAIDQGDSIDGLDIGATDAYPDDIVGVAVLERQLVFFGTQSYEIHQDTGAADFPIERVHATEIGCLSGQSIAKADTDTQKTLIWVAPDHTVRLMSGYSSQVISTNEIEQLIKDLHLAGGINQLSATAWSDSGLFQYALSCDSWTRIWDAKTGNWREEKSYGSDRWRVSKVVQFGSKLIAGDYATGQLYEIRNDVYTQNGEPHVLEVITPAVHAFPYPLQFNALYLSAAVGVGLNSENDYEAEPKVMVSISKDGGNTWSAERERSLGRLGQTMRRIQPIYRLGSAGANGIQVRLRISAPVERVMIQASVDFDRLEA